MANEDITKLRIDKTTAIARPLRRKKFLYWLTAGSILVLIIALYLTGILSPATEVEVSTVVQIYPSQTFTLLNASGYVVAQRKAAVASKITGRLVSVSVEEGSIVKKGDVIARLEGEDVDALKGQAEANLDVSYSSLDQAKAELNEATLSFNRNKELLDQGLVTRAQFDSAEARYKKALASVKGAEDAINANKAALRAAKVSLEYTLIRAPFDAVVLTKNADIGDIVTPLGAAANAKASVVTIADMSSLQIEVDVSEANLGIVKVGQPCEIQLDAFPDARFQGKVHMIVPTADRTKASVMVKIKFLDKDKRILPEMSAKVAFLERPVRPDEKKPRAVINPAAIINNNGKKTVYLIKENKVTETPITTGAQLGDLIEISSGVSVGDRVVLKPLNKMKNSAKIKVAEK